MAAFASASDAWGAKVSEAGAPAVVFAGHGGRLEAARTTWPDAPSPWLDLSTGVNPQAYPAPRASRAMRARLPDPAALAELEAVAAAAFGAAPAHVCTTAGAEAGLRLLALSLPAHKVTIVAPTYGGHAEAWADAGAAVTTVTDAQAADGDAVVLVNPNNPDGRRLQAREVLALARRQAERNGWLIVDESFVEAAPELSVAAGAGGALVVLRSFGKFYGLAGLRLGFVLGAPSLLARLRARQGEWPVSADAIAAGAAAYPDARWAGRTRRRLARDSTRLAAMLSATGFEVLGGAQLFLLVRAPDAMIRFERLARRGVLVRPFDRAPDQLRFGLPPCGAWRRLETALKESAR